MDKFESKRLFYKPDRVKILFIGESRPQQGTFFYNEDSNLYGYTKQAFEKFFPFSLEKFRELGCWLYDVCDSPVNGLDKADRKRAIDGGLKGLKKKVEALKPQFIIVVKKGYFGRAVLKSLSREGVFNLPFPACGRQLEYRDGLIEILKDIL